MDHSQGQIKALVEWWQLTCGGDTVSIFIFSR